MDTDGDERDERFDEALALLEDRRFLEAVDAFSGLVALSPDMTGAYGNRGLAYLNLGLEEEARQDFETVLRLNPEDPMGHCMLAELCRFNGTLEEVLGHVNAALEVSEDEPQAYFLRGWLFARAGQWEMAAEDLGKFVASLGESEAGDVGDLYEICRILAAEEPVDAEGRAVDSPDRVEALFRERGWSFDYRPNPEYEEEELPCLYGHCIRNRPPLAEEAAEGCPVFGYSCPGGAEQTAWCGDHPPFLD